MARKAQGQGDKKTCNICKKQLSINKFYLSNSPLFADGRVPICKDCLIKDVDENDPKLEKLLERLQMIDRPFIRKYWDSAVKSRQNSVKAYIRMISSLKETNSLRFQDGEQVIAGEDINPYTDKGKHKGGYSDGYQNMVKDFEITPDMIRRWSGYNREEIIMLENYYNELLSEHDFTKPQDREACKTLAELSLHMNRLMKEGRYQDWAKLNAEKQKIMQNSGLRPIDRKSTDEAKGIRSFGQLFAEVEKHGFVEPYPVEENQDIVDRTIQYMLDHVLRLLDAEGLAEPPEDTPKVDGGDSDE